MERFRGPHNEQYRHDAHDSAHPASPREPGMPSIAGEPGEDAAPEPGHYTAGSPMESNEESYWSKMRRAVTRPLAPLPEDEEDDGDDTEKEATEQAHDEEADTALAEEREEPGKSENVEADDVDTDDMDPDDTGSDNTDETPDHLKDTDELDPAAASPPPPGQEASPERSTHRFRGSNPYDATRPFYPLMYEPEVHEEAIEEEEIHEEDSPTPTGLPIPDEAEADDDTMILDPNKVPAAGTHQSAQGFAAAALRDVGRVRQNNQDSVLCFTTTVPREGMDMTLGLFVVADGMGGHHGGEIASRLATTTILHEVLDQLVLPAMEDGAIEALQPLMISAVQQANYAIWEHAQTVGSDMGTTCTAVLLLGQALYIAHVGDSRAYLREAAGLRPLTADHSTVGRLIEMGQLDPAGARDHPLRNQLYRTIGQQPNVQVDFVYQPLNSSTHVLICSDGLWGMISDEELEQALTQSPWPQDACNELIARANLAGGEDNISAVVVTLPLAERPSP